MTAEREFHIGDVLTAMTGRLVSPRHMEGVYDILGYMAGEGVMTHQIPRVSREVEPFLREAFPDLAAIEIPKFTGGKDEVLTWLGEQVAAHGETRGVPQLPEADHTCIDPIAEMKMMRPDVPIIALDGDA